MPFQNLFSLTWGIILVLIARLWLISVCLRNASIIDIFRGPGFLVIAWPTAHNARILLPRRDHEGLAVVGGVTEVLKAPGLGDRF